MAGGPTIFRRRIPFLKRPWLTEGGGRRSPADPRRDQGSRWGFAFYAGHILTIWGIALSNLFLLLAGLWLGRHRTRLDSLWVRSSRVLLPLGLYVLFTVVSTIFSLEPTRSAGELREFLNLTTLVLGLVWLRTTEQIRWLLSAFLAMTVAIGCLGAYQFFFTEAGSLNHRITGGFSHYQTYSGVLVLGVLVACARLLTPAKSRIELWPVIAWLMFVLSLTLTRGAWVAVLATFLALPLVVGSKRQQGMVFACIAALFAVANLGTKTTSHLETGTQVEAEAGADPGVWVDIWSQRVGSITSLKDPSNYDRLCMLEAGLIMVKERPFFGLGLNMVRDRYPIYRHPTAPRFQVPHLHNSFLQLAAERGLLTLFAYLALFAAGCGMAWRGFRDEGGRDGSRADIYLSVLLPLFGFNVAGLFENNWGDTEVQRIILFLLSIPFCLRNHGEPESTLHT